MNSGIFKEVGFNLRKACRECLRKASEYFEVVVFTASVKNYADSILDHIDPDNTLIHHRLYRDSCVFSKESGVYIKDLRIFEGVDLNDIVLVDNAVYSFAY
jgi:CTD small phosphatase-like protein 2